MHFNVSMKAASLVGSSLGGLALAYGPLGAFVADRLGCKISVVVGSVLGSICCISCALLLDQMPFVLFLIIFGFVLSFAFNILFVPAVTSCSFFFVDKQPIATGIATSGSGFGITIMSLLTSAVLQKFGIRGVLLTYSGLLALPSTMFFIFPSTSEMDKRCLQNMAAEALEKPVEDLEKPVEDLEKTVVAMEKPVEALELAEALESTTTNNIDYFDFQTEINKPRSKSMSSVTSWSSLGSNPFPNLELRRMSAVNHIGPFIIAKYEEEVESMADPKNLLFDFSLLVLCVCYFLVMVPHYVPAFYIPSLIAQKTGQKPNMVITAMGISNVLSRLFGGHITQKVPFLKPAILIGMSILCALGSLIMFPLCDSVLSFSLTGFMFGMCMGAYNSLIVPQLCTMYPTKQLNSAFGMVNAGQGLGALAGPHVVGWILDHCHQNYETAFNFGACSYGVAFVLLALSVWLQQRKKNVDQQ